MVPEFKIKEQVSIINAQTSTKEVLIGSQGIHKWLGNLQKWTDVASGLLKTELEKRGATVNEGSPKVLKLAITRVNLFWGFSAIRCILYLRVETEDGYIKEYEGNNASPWTLYRACDGAVTKAVAAVLNDEKIFRYIRSSTLKEEDGKLALKQLLRKY